MVGTEAALRQRSPNINPKEIIFGQQAGEAVAMAFATLHDPQDVTAGRQQIRHLEASHVVTLPTVAKALMRRVAFLKQHGKAPDMIDLLFEGKGLHQSVAVAPSKYPDRAWDVVAYTEREIPIDDPRVHARRVAFTPAGVTEELAHATYTRSRRLQHAEHMTRAGMVRIVQVLETEEPELVYVEKNYGPDTTDPYTLALTSISNFQNPQRPKNYTVCPPAPSGVSRVDAVATPGNATLALPTHLAYGDQWAALSF